MEAALPGIDSVVPTAVALLDLVNTDPRAAADEAILLLGRLGADDAVAAAVAQRAQGLAYAKMGEVGDAIRAFGGAVAAAHRAGDPVLLGEVRMSQAGVLGFAGDTAGAMDAIGESVHLLEGAALARALVQRSTILYRAGDLAGARRDLEEAAPVLEAMGDEVWLAHLYSNRGILHGYRGDAASAERDLLRARALFERRGQRSAAAEAVQNLGWVASIAGDVVMALRYLDEAEEEFTRQGHSLGELLRDRAIALMSVHLTAEARTLSEAAARRLHREGLDAAFAEALVEAARASALDGDDVAARTGAESAAEEFDRQGRASWSLLARYLVLEVRARQGELAARDLVSVDAICDELQAAGLERESRHARLLLLRLAAEMGELGVAERIGPLAVRSRGSGPIDVRVDAWSGLAALRRARGDLRGASSAARAGLRVVDAYQAAIGASEMRVAVAGHTRFLAAIGLELAYRSGRPRRVFAWMERTRAGALRFPAVRPPDDARLAEDLARLRRIDTELRADPDSPSRPVLERDRVRVQESIRRRSRTVSPTAHPDDGAPEMKDIAAALGDALLVEIDQFAGCYHAVTVWRGRSSHRLLGHVVDVSRALDALRAGLARSASRPKGTPSRAAADELVDAAVDDLDELLVPVLPSRATSVVLVPSAELHAVPWGLLPTLRGRPVSVAPSARLWLERSRRSGRRGHGAIVVGGPGLPGASREARDVAASYGAATRFTARSSRVEDVLRALDGARVAHIVAHGSFRADNPLFSSLRLADGGLTVYDLERVRRLPLVMVLSACNSGIQAVRPGNETMGIVAGLLGAGVRTVIASTGLVPDTSATARTMVELHRRLARGAPPAASLAAAQEGSLRTGRGGAAAASFVCFGAG